MYTTTARTNVQQITTTTTTTTLWGIKNTPKVIDRKDV